MEGDAMRKSKLIAISVAGLLGLSSFVAVTGRIAHTETVYYSDATKTLPVGYETIPCEGRVILEGTRTAYATEVFRMLCGWPNDDPRVP